MKPSRLLLVVSFLLVVFLATLLLKNSSQPVYAVSHNAYHKVIAPPELSDLAIPGFDLWHDYGSFGLYRLSDQALRGLTEEIRTQVRLVDEMDWILLAAQPFDSQGEALAIPAHLALAENEGEGLHLVQFVGPIKAEWLSAVQRTGAELVHYIANNAYLVWAGSESLRRLDTFVQEGDFMQYRDVYQPYFKVGASLLDRVIRMDDPEALVHVVVQVFSHPGIAATQEVIAALSLQQVNRWYPVLAYQNAEFIVRVRDIPTMVKRPDVFWVGERLPRTLMDEVQGQILASNFDPSMAGPTGPGYLDWLDSYGFSQNPGDYPILDIADDGIGNGTVDSGDYSLHEYGSLGYPTRLAYIHNCTSAPSGEGQDGHGHINASIAGGYDSNTGFPYQDGEGFNLGLGINPYARLGGTRIFSFEFDISNCGYSDPGLIKSIQDNGAQISSNSWGCGLCAGTYDESSQAYDVGARDADLYEPGNQEMIFVFAAGNDGPSPNSIGTPGNGKNVITVGASESDRPTWTDGCGVHPNGADNAMDVIGFSSRGPAPGGRVKPEVIAPGTHIQGTASTSSNYTGVSVCDMYHPAGQTLFAASSGTSHSTPAVSGVASLYYYWLENNYGISPSPALMKAYLIAHPTYLTGASANDTLPSNDQGYGMPNMALALDTTPRVLHDQTRVFDNSGETWQFSASVADPAKAVRIVLAYTDKAGAVGTSPQVNDLNLQAAIAGSNYLGNHFSGQWSTPGGSPDSANNYEAIFLPPGTSGPLEITVTGFNIADDGIPNQGDTTDQDFALVCYNCLAAPDFTLAVTPQTEAICVPAEGHYEVAVGQVSGFDDPVPLTVTGNPAGTTASFSSNPLVPPAAATLTIGNTGGVSFGSYSLEVMGIAPTSTHTATVGLAVYTASPGVATLVNPVDGAIDQQLAPTFEWTGAFQAGPYLLEVAQDAGFSSLVYTATLAGTTHTAGTVLEPGTWYYWRVRTDNACGSGPSSDIFNFRTRDVPPVLVVDDDDNDPDVKAYYTGALDALGVEYEVWDTHNSDAEPAESELTPYEAVIWFTGDEYGEFAGPGPAGEVALGGWLDGGNCLLISSQDYFYDRGLTPFMQTYLGVVQINGDLGEFSNVSGVGSVFAGLGPYRLDYPFTNYSDELVAGATTEQAFMGGNGNLAGVDKSGEIYKTVFLGFPFEALALPADRQEVMSTFLDWCMRSSQVFVPLVIR